MKIRVLKSQMNKALMWYTNQLYERHSARLLSPASIELMQRDLDALQTHIQTRETNPVWKVPVCLFLDLPHNTFEVVVADETNVLFLHED